MMIGEKKGSIPSFESFRRNTPKVESRLGKSQYANYEKEKIMRKIKEIRSLNG